MNKIWITSDWHFNHDREFIYKPRGFNSVHEMNKEIVSRHNEVVGANDDVYVLGDLMLGDNEIGISFIKQLKGNLHVIRGNHDTNSRMDIYNNCYNIVEITEGQYFKYNKYHFYLSHFPTITSNFNDDKPLQTRIINICGHVHTKDKFFDMDKGLIYHCEVDAHNCYPVPIDTIIEDIKRRVYE